MMLNLFNVVKPPFAHRFFLMLAKRRYNAVKECYSDHRQTCCQVLEKRSFHQDSAPAGNVVFKGSRLKVSYGINQIKHLDRRLFSHERTERLERLLEIVG